MAIIPTEQKYIILQDVTINKIQAYRHKNTRQKILNKA